MDADRAKQDERDLRLVRQIEGWADALEQIDQPYVGLSFLSGIRGEIEAAEIDLKLLRGELRWQAKVAILRIARATQRIYEEL